jgi:hypothetical protein
VAVFVSTSALVLVHVPLFPSPLYTPPPGPVNYTSVCTVPGAIRN